MRLMALAGLVANYSDSSDEEEEEATEAVTNIISTNNESADYFVGTQSESDSESDGEAEAKQDLANDPLPNPLARGDKTLPLPSPSAWAPSQGTVFGNRFADQEKAELAIFEKHVKMTEDRSSNRPPCFKFRKGACRKGNGCRFSHDLGFQALNSRVSDDSANTSATNTVGSDSSEVGQPKAALTKRIGVTNTLLPAKKAKHSLNNQRARERPWTLKE